MPKRPGKRAPRPTSISPSMKPVGILGGGQLARMLALKAHELGLPTAVLSERPEDPAAQVTSLWIPGKPGDRSSLISFLKKCSVVTFESEFMDAHLLDQLAAETGTTIFPRPKDMASVQDRLSQKELLKKHKLPTSEYLQIDDLESAREAFASFGEAVVFKKRRFGYDGYGTFVVRSKKELNTFLESLANSPDTKNGFIAERFIPFRRELAVMVARNPKGQTTRLPFVETFQENSRCLWVKGPLKNTATLARLGRKLEDFLTAIDYVGVMGVELFDTGRGALINELAPRVHNSGHYSMDAMSMDQFELHLRAILDLEFEKPRPLAKGFAMMNLLGRKDAPASWHLPVDIHLHWYGKSENRPGRKMGHFNVLGQSPEKALVLARKRRENFDV